MAGSLVASDKFTFADGNAGHTITLPSVPVAGDIDVILVGSVTVISGVSSAGQAWTLDESHLDQDAVNGYHRVCTGTEGTTFTVTTSGNFNTAVTWQRWRGLDAYEVSTIAVSTGPGVSPAAATGTLSVAGELVIGMAFMSQTGVADQAVTSWAAGLTSDKEAKLGSTSLGVFIASGYRTAGVTTAGLSPAVSWTGDATSIATTVSWAFTIAAAGVTVAVAGTAPAPTGAFVFARPISIAADGVAPAARGAFVFRLEGETDEEPGSWYQLLDISREHRMRLEEQRTAEPIACWDDGEPLRTGPRGESYCPFCGRRY